MDVEKRELGGGITLHAVKTEKFKTEHVSVNFVMPFKRETVTRVSLLRGLLLRGCEGYPTFEKLSARTDELYGAEINIDTSAYGDVLVLSVSAVSLEGRFSDDGTDITGGIFDLLRRICFFPLTDNGGFLPEYTKSEKKRLFDEIEAKINNKGAYAQKRLGEEMFGKECGGLSRLGYVEDIDAITPIGEYLFFRELVKTCPVHVYTVGALDASQAEYYATTLFDGVEREPSCAVLAARFGDTENGESKHVFEEMDIKQGKLCMGYRTKTVLSEGSDYAHLLVANEIFGASPISKLFMHVREELNLCYYCQSSYRSMLGAVTVSAGIDGANFKKTIDAVNEMLTLVKNGDFDEGELEVAKRSLVSTVRTGFDSPRYIMTFMLARELCGIKDTPENLISRIETATREDVSKAAKGLRLDTVYFLCPDGEEAKNQL